MAEETKAPDTAQPETPTAAKTYTAEEYQALESRITSLTAQLDEAGKTIQSYKDMDIDGIRQRAEEWEKKCGELEAAQKAKAYSDELDKFVQAQGMKNDIYAAHLKSQLEAAELKFDKDGTLIGGSEIVSKLKASCPDAFADTQPKPHFVDSTPGSTAHTPDDAEIRKIMGLK